MTSKEEIINEEQSKYFVKSGSECKKNQTVCIKFWELWT